MCPFSQSEGQLSIQSEVDLLLNLFKEVDIVGKVTIKHKLLDIVCPSMTSMLPPASKIKTKGGPKSHRSKKSTKRDPSYFEHVDAFIESSRQDTCVAKTENKLKTKGVIQEKDNTHARTVQSCFSALYSGCCGCSGRWSLWV